MVVGVPRISDGSYTMPKALLLGNAPMLCAPLRGICSGWRAHNPKSGTLYAVEAISYISQQAKGKMCGLNLRFSSLESTLDGCTLDSVLTIHTLPVCRYVV